MMRRNAIPHMPPTLSLPHAGGETARREGPERGRSPQKLAAPDGGFPDRPLAWGAGLSVLAHGAVLALAIALVSSTSRIELPDPIPIEIVYATSPSPARVALAPPAPAPAVPAPAPKPATAATPAPPPPQPTTAPPQPEAPAPDSVALPEKKAAVPRPIPPLPPIRPRFGPPPKPKEAPQPAPRMAALPVRKHFSIFAPGFKPPVTPAAPTRRVPAPAATGAPAPHTTPPVYAEAELGNRPPIYPAIARENGWQGHVLLRAHILADGRLDNLSVAKSSGYDILDESALAAVRVWRFRPARKDGVAVSSVLDLGFTFHLAGGR